MRKNFMAALGFGIGVVIYDYLKDGFDGIDFFRAIFVGTFIFIANLISSKFEKKEDERKNVN